MLSKWGEPKRTQETGFLKETRFLAAVWQTPGFSLRYCK
jgi:hypothetical protein